MIEVLMAVWGRRPERRVVVHSDQGSQFGSLKKERVKKRVYKTRDLARADIFDYIEVFYTRSRRDSHLGGISPEAFERAAG